MPWYYFLSYFFGGTFLVNAIPHFANGISGRPFQSPFSKPPGQGLSSSTTNVLWGAFNIVIGYLLICQVGRFNLHSLHHVAPMGLGSLVMALIHAKTFGRFHGGNSPSNTGKG